MKKKTTEEFIDEAKKIHGNKYDYSECEYIKATENVTIICPEHGEFLQTPSNHLKGQGCPKCGHNNKGEKRRLTTEEFIKRSIKVHNTKYDYSKVKYEKNNVKVCIICPEHGEYWITPANHLNGQGCPKCGHIKQGVGRRKDKDEIIQRFINVHGDRYDYSQMDYIDTTKKVYIICKEHGGFWQTPENHFNGYGCPKCGGHERKTTEEFIRESRVIHGDRYDYSKVIYNNTNTCVCIICPEHGEFWQIPANHLQGQGCPKCVGKNKTTESFVNELKKIFGDKYDYSKVIYKGAYDKVLIICPTHGEFLATPHSLLHGSGCRQCGINNRVDKQRKTFEKLQNDVERIYGKGYIDLSKVHYVNAHTPIIISTPYIGEIEITPNKLTSKKLYKLLKESYLEHRIRLYLQEHNIKFNTQKRFEWLVDNGPMRLDFYLPEYNIAIECQGVQHFVPVKYFKMDFEGQRKRDELKFMQCTENHINIYYYTDEQYLKYSNISTIYENRIFSNIDDITNKIIKI